jgi:hypothetical protein
MITARMHINKNDTVEAHQYGDKDNGLFITELWHYSNKFIPRKLIRKTRAWGVSNEFGDVPTESNESKE